jgi:hypothetical protein
MSTRPFIYVGNTRVTAISYNDSFTFQIDTRNYDITSNVEYVNAEEALKAGVEFIKEIT